MPRNCVQFSPGQCLADQSFDLYLGPGDCPCRPILLAWLSLVRSLDCILRKESTMLLWLCERPFWVSRPGRSVRAVLAGRLTSSCSTGLGVASTSASSDCPCDPLVSLSLSAAPGWRPWSTSLSVASSSPSLLAWFRSVATASSLVARVVYISRLLQGLPGSCLSAVSSSCSLSSFWPLVQSTLETLSSASLAICALSSSSPLLFCVSMWPVCWSTSGVSCMRSVVAFLLSAAVGVAPDPMTSPQGGVPGTTGLGLAPLASPGDVLSWWLSCALLPCLSMPLLPCPSMPLLPCLSVDATVVVSVCRCHCCRVCLSIPLLPCLSMPLLPCPSMPLLPCLSMSLLPCLSMPLFPCLSMSLLPCLSMPLLPCPSMSLLRCLSMSLLPCPSMSLLLCLSMSLLPCLSMSLLPCLSMPRLLFCPLCSLLSGDGAYSVSLLLSGVPQVRGVRACWPITAGWAGCRSGHVVHPPNPPPPNPHSLLVTRLKHTWNRRTTHSSFLTARIIWAMATFSSAMDWGLFSYTWSFKSPQRFLKKKSDV